MQQNQKLVIFPLWPVFIGFFMQQAPGNDFALHTVIGTQWKVIVLHSGHGYMYGTLESVM